MARLISRIVLIALSLAAGTWVSVGMPDAARSREMGAQMLARAKERLHAGTAPSSPAPPTPPSANDDARAVDPSLLPDPTPWPRLNPHASIARAWLLAEGPARSAEHPRHLVTFTFDDGPFPETTPGLLKLLARYNVHASFFFIGRYLDGDDERAVASREAAKQIAAAGHLIGNHTHDHQLLTTLPRTSAMAQIDDGAASIERAIGKRPVLFRPPYGKLDDWTKQLVRERGLELVLWSVEAQDMREEDPDVVYDKIKGQLEYAQGGVVLLHDIRFSSGIAMDKLLKWLSLHKWDPATPDKPGFDVVDLPEYLRATAERPQPFADRKALEKARSEAWQKAHGQRTPHAAALIVGEE